MKNKRKKNKHWKDNLQLLTLALPTIIIVAKEDKKSTPPMIIMSIVLGTLIGMIQYFLL